MSDEPKKTISPDVYLQAVALFTMAEQHYRECNKYHKALCAMLGVDELGRIADALYAEYPDVSFDQALSKEGITVDPPVSLVIGDRP